MQKTLQVEDIDTGDDDESGGYGRHCVNRLGDKGDQEGAKTFSLWSV